MAIESVTTQITTRLVHAKAIADLMSNANTEHLLNSTLADAGAALVDLLDQVLELNQGARQ